MEQSMYNEVGLKSCFHHVPFFGVFDPCGIQAFEYFAAAKGTLNQKAN